MHQKLIASSDCHTTLPAMAHRKQLLRHPPALPARLSRIPAAELVSADGHSGRRPGYLLILMMQQHHNTSDLSSTHEHGLLQGPKQLTPSSTLPQGSWQQHNLTSTSQVPHSLPLLQGSGQLAAGSMPGSSWPALPSQHGPHSFPQHPSSFPPHPSSLHQIPENLPHQLPIDALSHQHLPDVPDLSFPLLPEGGQARAPPICLLCLPELHSCSQHQGARAARCQSGRGHQMPAAPKACTQHAAARVAPQAPQPRPDSCPGLPDEHKPSHSSCQTCPPGSRMKSCTAAAGTAAWGGLWRPAALVQQRPARRRGLAAAGPVLHRAAAAQGFPPRSQLLDACSGAWRAGKSEPCPWGCDPAGGVASLAASTWVEGDPGLLGRHPKLAICPRLQGSFALVCRAGYRPDRGGMVSGMLG